MVKVKLIVKTKGKNGDPKREVREEKDIKKNKNYESFITELSKAFSLPKNKFVLKVLTEDDDENPINNQDDLSDNYGEAKEFMVIVKKR